MRRRRRKKGEKREQPTREGEMLTESSKQIGTIAVGREGRIGKRVPFLPFRFKAVESKVPACVCVCVIQTVSVYREVTRLRAYPRNVESCRSPSCALWGVEDVGEGSETARGQQHPESERENVRGVVCM